MFERLILLQVNVNSKILLKDSKEGKGGFIEKQTKEKNVLFNLLLMCEVNSVNTNSF